MMGSFSPFRFGWQRAGLVPGAGLRRDIEAGEPVARPVRFDLLPLGVDAITPHGAEPKRQTIDPARLVGPIERLAPEGTPTRGFLHPLPLIGGGDDLPTRSVGDF